MKMKIWTDKQGNKLTPSEFMARWKEGIMQVTPLQQTKSVINSTWIILIGVICGIVISLFNFKQLWWVLIILGGALINTSISQIATYQKYKALKDIEDIINVTGIDGVKR